MEAEEQEEEAREMRRQCSGIVHERVQCQGEIELGISAMLSTPLNRDADWLAY